MPSTREQVLSALFDRAASSSPAAAVKRNEALPASVPAGGLVILRDGDPGEPDVTLNPRTEFYSHRAEIEAFVTQPVGGGGEAALDALLAEIGTALASRPQPRRPRREPVLERARDVGAGDRGRGADPHRPHHRHHRVPGQRSAGRLTFPPARRTEHAQGPRLRRRRDAARLAARPPTASRRSSGYRSLDFKSTDLSAEQPLGDDPLLGRGRNAQDPYRGLITDEGKVEIPLDLRGSGFWLTGLFGDPTTTQTKAAGHIALCCSAGGVSIGTETGPRIGVQKGPLCRVSLRACPGSEQEGPARVAQCPHERRSGARGRCLFAHLGKPGVGSGRGRAAQARFLKRQDFVAGLDDLAVMGQAIEQRGRHLGVAEDARPFAEGEVGGDEDRGALVEPADQMEQQLPAGLGEGQIAQFVEDDEVEAGEIVGEASLTAGAGLAAPAG